MYVFFSSIQGMHVMWVALGGRCLSGIRMLLSDARMESQMEVDGVVESNATAATLDPLCTHTAAQRVARLTLCIPLHQVSDDSILIYSLCSTCAVTYGSGVLKKVIALPEDREYHM
jgi:hypothetical protein